MSRYIDADAYERELRTSNIIHHYGEQIVDKIHSAPSIDIVRCKECKYARMTYGGECKYCEKWSLEDSLYLDGDFFCSYGEREDE